MKEKVDEKLRKIAHIWDDYIFKSKFFDSKFRFNDDIKTNYFGDILHYFFDTFSILNKDCESNSFQENFENSISFLQAIYIQQDFIEELHLIFKTGKNKGDLNSDPNYSINREIRNESVGHPIRKTAIPRDNSETTKCPACGNISSKGNKKQTLLSSTLFTDRTNPKDITYLRYHRDNNFEFEEVIFPKEEILSRHYEFLNTNLDVILGKLKSILKLFLKKVIEIEQVKDSIPIEGLTTLIAHSYESIYNFDPLFQPKILIELAQRESEHLRYQVALNSFYEDLDVFIKETKESLFEYVDNNDKHANSNNLEEKTSETNIEIQIKPNLNTDKRSFRYELQKLAEPEGNRNFKRSTSLLKRKCENMPDVLEEIDHMTNNLGNTLEYYSSYKLIRKLLQADE